ncbi:MAG: D-alanyl-D-alanine carboxypeptidase/D-alanyl-D-alanine-endopeptidase [Acidobacteria bacterium]|nr:D-alanyl-D-alanine carboxypeptidase/D-alanyl-D-alanine-endopeptidase [Acidobacteriota bacterium]
MFPAPLCVCGFLFLLLPVLTQAATLAQRLERILSQPAARRAFWGIKIVDLDSGQTLYQLNAERFFVPASNAKLFSTALALVRLGPEHRFLTRLAATAPPDAEGRIAGELVLAGGGDPNFSSRVLPYEKQTAFGANRLEPIEELAAQAAAAGVREISGDIVGDDAFYPWERYPDGWSYHDILGQDGAPVTALVFNDNVAALRIRPGHAPGEPASVSVDPPVPYFRIDSRIRTVAAAPRPIGVDRGFDEQSLRLWGEIAAGGAGRAEVVAIADPALFAAQALRDALARRSITVLGRAVSRHAFPGEPAAEYPWTLASCSSMSLIEVLRVINKTSQNLHAELVLRAAARERRGAGSIEAALAELKEFLHEAGAGDSDFFLRDGSGLSRKDLVTPSALVAVLAYMWRSAHRELWLETLPVAGSDGTLRGRFLKTDVAEHLQAKTGSLSHVVALSGYLEPPSGRHLAFSILANNFNGPAGPFRAVVDRLCAEIFQ